MKKLLLFVSVAVLMACANGNTNSTAADVTEKSDSVIVYEHDYLVKVGDMAPDFTLKYTDGSEFTLSQQRGKVVML